MSMRRYSYLYREVYHGVDLVSPISVVGESLEVDDENLREAPEVELLGCLLVFLTIGTVPGVIRPQLLLTGVELQTFH